MKATAKIEQQIEITHIRIRVPVRYEEEDIPNDFPLRRGDVWTARVAVDTGKIEGWPVGKSGSLYMKVCDEGTYTIYDSRGSEVACIDEGYVPHGIVPGSYGDYIELDIDENGVIANWPKNPDVSEFLEDE